MVLPIVIRAAYAGFRSVPEELRLGAAALGLTRVTTLWHLLLPAATHGVVVGVLLAIGRASAETAALIFTSGYVTRMPRSLFDSGRTLSVHIYDLAMHVTGGDANAHATSLVLMALLLILNVAALQGTQRWLNSKVAV
jgi:phosphate transport system permease protein